MTFLLSGMVKGWSKTAALSLDLGGSNRLQERQGCRSLAPSGGGRESNPPTGGDPAHRF
jgi:hypothetical protein